MQKNSRQQESHCFKDHFKILDKEIKPRDGKPQEAARPTIILYYVLSSVFLCTAFVSLIYLINKPHTSYSKSSTFTSLSNLTTFFLLATITLSIILHLKTLEHLTSPQSPLPYQSLSPLLDHILSTLLHSKLTLVLISLLSTPSPQSLLPKILLVTLLLFLPIPRIFRKSVWALSRFSVYTTQRVRVGAKKFCDKFTRRQN